MMSIREALDNAAVEFVIWANVDVSVELPGLLDLNPPLSLKVIAISVRASVVS